MQRRTFITLIGGATAWPLAARAQQPGKTYRVGLLATGGAIGGGDERRKAILEVLAAHGFVEGRNLAFEARWGDGRYDRLSEYAAALKASKVDVIVTFGYGCGGHPAFPTPSFFEAKDSCTTRAHRAARRGLASEIDAHQKSSWLFEN